MITDVMKQEIAALEDAVEMAISENVPPVVSDWIIRSPIYKDTTGKIADVLFMFMDPNTGEIDGASAHALLSQRYPGITKWVSVPQENFKIRDEVNHIATTFIGRSIV